MCWRDLQSARIGVLFTCLLLLYCQAQRHLLYRVASAQACKLRVLAWNATPHVMLSATRHWCGSGLCQGLLLMHAPCVCIN